MFPALWGLSMIIHDYPWLSMIIPLSTYLVFLSRHIASLFWYGITPQTKQDHLNQLPSLRWSLGPEFAKWPQGALQSHVPVEPSTCHSPSFSLTSFPPTRQWQHWSSQTTSNNKSKRSVWCVYYILYIIYYILYIIYYILYIIYYILYIIYYILYIIYYILHIIYYILYIIYYILHIIYFILYIMYIIYYVYYILY